MSEQEIVIWEGHPSQWSNFPAFFLCGLSCLLVITIPFAISIAVWRWLETSRHVYRITSERLTITRGVFSKRTDGLELYRVKDTTLLEPFWLRQMSLGNIVLLTSDRTTPVVQISAVPNASRLREELRRNVERMRVQKGVRETDVGEVVR